MFGRRTRGLEFFNHVMDSRHSGCFPERLPSAISRAGTQVAHEARHGTGREHCPDVVGCEVGLNNIEFRLSCQFPSPACWAIEG